MTVAVLTRRRWRLGGAIALVAAVFGCRPDPSPRREIGSETASSTTAREGERPSASGGNSSGVNSSGGSAASTESTVAAAPPALGVDGWADRDPTNDGVVAPPDAVADCHERLTELGVTFTKSELPLRQRINGIPTCGANDAVVYQKGPTGLEIRPPALVTCRLALGLVDVEKLLQELAQKELGSRVKRLHQGGTYNCRKMARFDLVSEHSYGNAIDVRSFTLEDGRLVSVDEHFGPLAEPPANERARFLRTLGEQAFDRHLVSVSLGPYWDALHKDHFHFDMAHYRVDGSRP